MRDYLNIGPTPADESCAQVGSPNYEMKARQECHRYIKAIRQVVGKEEGTARLAVKGSPHDFGSYYEVVCYYDLEDRVGLDYALRCDEEAPNEWPEETEATSSLPGTVGHILAHKSKAQEIRDHANSLTEEDMREMMFDGDVTAADGCLVDPDGSCPHGYPSPLLTLEII